jgi:hypothetical protein
MQLHGGFTLAIEQEISYFFLQMSWTGTEKKAGKADMQPLKETLHLNSILKNFIK